MYILPLSATSLAVVLHNAPTVKFDSRFVVRGSLLGEQLETSLAITDVIRRLPGASQAHMVRCDDGRHYVAKFAGNPSENRTLINEWLVSHLLNRLGVSTPDCRILYLPPGIPQSDAIYSAMGTKRVPVSDDLHFGSAYPVNPETMAIFDELPQRFLQTVVNLSDFATCWVLAKWVNQTGGRKAVFVKEEGASPTRFRAFMIGHGMAFNGTKWEFRDPAPSRPDRNRRVYGFLDMPTECERALLQIDGLDPDILKNAERSVPSSWFGPGDRERLDVLIATLWTRHTDLRSMIHRHLIIPAGSECERIAMVTVPEITMHH